VGVEHGEKEQRGELGLGTEDLEDLYYASMGLVV
jgi:hypothetical protein